MKGVYFIELDLEIFEKLISRETTSAFTTKKPRRQKVRPDLNKKYIL